MRWLCLVCLWITPVMAADLSSDGETPGTKVVVQQLQRSGDAVTLRFSLVNSSDQTITGNFLSGRETFTVDGVYLVDTVGKKKYEVIHDTAGHCVCSQKLANIQPKATLNLWAKLPAPPETVGKIGVSIPHFIPIDSVPITAAE